MIAFYMEKILFFFEPDRLIFLNSFWSGFMLKFGMVLCALLLVACGSDGSNTANADVDDDVLLDSRDGRHL